MIEKKNGKIVLFVSTLLIIMVFPFSQLIAQSSKKSLNSIESKFYKESNIRVEFISQNIARVSIVPEGSSFKNSGLNRYGFISEPDTRKLDLKITESKNGFTTQTPYMQVKANCTTGEIVVTDKSGKKILLNQTASGFKNGITQAVFNADKQEDWIGFGDQTRKRLYHRGYMADCNIRNARSYIPVPYFMSTNGVGVLVNTTYHIVFDMCKTDKDKFSWQDKSGTIDYYVIVGNGFNELINLYTQLTGRPKLPPQWAFGLWYICRTQANDYEAIGDALNFRREEIPADVIGLEPGWMETNYDYSTEKKWSSDRFPLPEWVNRGPASFVKAVKRLGFKMELWLCNDYDLSYEEERKIGNDLSKMENQKPASQVNENKNAGDKKSNSDVQKATGKNNDNALFDVDEHLTGGITTADKITKKQEPWFQHLNNFMDDGISFFKQDASNQVNMHPGRIWGNGMSDAEMHNLYPLLYSRQMYDGIKAKTKLRPVVFTPCGWTGFQAFGGTWTGDTGGGLATLGALSNTAIVGHSWSTVDMEVRSKEGIHFGYLAPWSQINSWTYFNMPWVQGTELLNMHKFYSQFRSKLIPYLYTWAKFATETGWPLLRPLTLRFPKDKNCRENLHQYLLGPDLMVGIFNKSIYFPEGQWKDYWTGEVVDGSQEKSVSWPVDRGGALYVRSGAIIPFGPLMQYRGEKPMDEITLYIFPDKKETILNFYEDDGLSFEYEQGKYSTTRIAAKSTMDGSMIQIDAPKGNFEGMVNNRTWNITMHANSKPGQVFCYDKPVLKENISWDENRKELLVKGLVAPAVIIVR